MTRRRKRVRASDLDAPNPRRGLPMLVVLAIALGIVIAYKATVGDQTAKFMDTVVRDPNLELPPSTTDLQDAAPTPDAGR